MNAHCASVALPLPLFSEFSYFIPSFLENKIEVGSLVEVEFKNRYLLGWVVALEDEPPPSLEVKEILRLAPVVPLGKVKLLWAKTLSQLYLIPWGMVLSLFTPVLLPSFWEAAGSRVFSGSHDMDQKEGFSVPSQGMNFFVFQEKFGRKKKKWEKLVKNGVLRFQEEIFKVEDTVYPQGDLGWWSIATQKEREAFFL
ncbi:MAG: 3DNA-binding domain, partial [Candidatus Atribacteria bacterium]|nr:3DNA-binding domain [Candidatus Atribacteria bacterium]